MSKCKIRSDIVKRLREDMNLSQMQLSKKSRLSQKTISNLEHGYETKAEHFANLTTTDRLVKALSSEKAVLAGEKAIPDRPENKEVSIKLSAKVELNYDLLAKYYGITKQEIFDVAPLLFFIAAERSLDLQLVDVESSSVDVEDDFVELEELKERFDAYTMRDIFEKSVVSGSSPFINNPFTNFLEKEVSEPRFKSQIDFTEAYDRLFTGYVHYTFNRHIPDYLVCKELFSEITLGREMAKEALLEGTVKITEIPEQLMDSQQAFERINWIEKKHETRKPRENSNDA